MDLGEVAQHPKRGSVFHFISALILIFEFFFKTIQALSNGLLNCKLSHKWESGEGEEKKKTCLSKEFPL